MFKSFGLPEILIILAILLLIFGAGKLPQIGKSLGSSFREFKSGISGDEKKSESHTASGTTNSNQSASSKQH